MPNGALDKGLDSDDLIVWIVMPLGTAGGFLLCGGGGGGRRTFGASDEDKLLLMGPNELCLIFSWPEGPRNIEMGFVAPATP